MYTYEPHDKDPKDELQVCLSFYRKLVTRLHIWDDMEFVNYLSARDGVEWALEQLGRDEPEEYWWWYLDGGKSDGPLEPVETVGEMWKPVESAPVAAVAEEHAPFKVQPHDESSDG
jgi:hypothetical protein